MEKGKKHRRGREIIIPINYKNVDLREGDILERKIGG